MVTVDSARAFGGPLAVGDLISVNLVVEYYSGGYALADQRLNHVAAGSLVMLSPSGCGKTTPLPVWRYSAPEVWGDCRRADITTLRRAGELPAQQGHIVFQAPNSGAQPDRCRENADGAGARMSP